MKDWLEKYKLVRRLALLWAISLITYVTVAVMQPAVILHLNASSATVVVAIIGILQVVVGLYQTTRAKEDTHAQDSNRYRDGS